MTCQKILKLPHPPRRKAQLLAMNSELTIVPIQRKIFKQESTK